MATNWKNEAFTIVNEIRDILDRTFEDSDGHEVNIFIQNLNINDENIVALLHEAIELEDDRIVEILLRRNHKIEVEQTPALRLMALAAQKGCINIMQMLRRQGITINTSIPGFHPMLSALETGEYDVVEWLYNEGIHMDSVKDKFGDSPIFFLIKRRSVPLLTLILNFGASPNVLDRAGDTPLHHAAYMSKKLFLLLIEWGGNVHATNTKGNTVLHNLALFNNASQISDSEMMNHMRPSLTALNREGLTPFEVALLHSSNEAAMALIEAGSAIRKSIGPHGDSALTYATFSGCKLQVIRKLIEKGVDINHANRLGKTALYNSYVLDYTKNAVALLDLGAKIFVHDTWPLFGRHTEYDMKFRIYLPFIAREKLNADIENDIDLQVIQKYNKKIYEHIIIAIQELKRLSSINFFQGLSYTDVLQVSNNKLLTLAQNEEFLTEKKFKIFKICKRELCRKRNWAIKNLKRWREKEVQLQKILGTKLPEPITTKIAKIVTLSEDHTE